MSGKTGDIAIQQWKEHLGRRLGGNTIMAREKLEAEWHQGHGAKRRARAAETALAARAAKAPPRAAAGDKAAQLAAIRTDLGECTRCKLHKGRTNIVFGEGNPDAEVMFVGEGPGETEDQMGRPFVGAAGKLLDKIIEAMGYRRADVYIANVVKSRPPGNRAPEPDEVAACSPFLFRQIDAIKPKVIVALGGTALKCLFGDEAKITRMRGKFTEFRGTQLMPTFHPAYLLRNPPAKKEVWEDMKKVLTHIGRPLPKGKGN